MIDLLASEYAITPMDALHNTPLAFAFMLAAATHRRNGGKFAGPDYVTRDLQAKLNGKEN